MTPGHAFLREGFALADSLSLDPHKWLFAPFDTGALLVRDPQALRDAYTKTAEYTAVTETEPLEAHAFFDHGLELSRRFRALKLWMVFKLRRVDTYRPPKPAHSAFREHPNEPLASEPTPQYLSSGWGHS